MFHHVEGELAALTPSRAVVSAGGIGLELRIPLTTYTALKGKEATKVRLLAHLQVLEDDLRLYGFASEEERIVFRLATSISGVGPAIALAILAAFSPADFGAAIEAEDATVLKKVRGVGPKLAERLVLELKDRAGPLAELTRGTAAATASPVPSSVIAEAVAALEALGFAAREAKSRVDGAVTKLLDDGNGKAREGSGPPAISVEAIIHAALRTRP